jgi:hypothetical protein
MERRLLTWRAHERAMLVPFVAGSLAACATESEHGIDEPPSTITPLADLRATLVFEGVDSFRIDAGVLGCPHVDPALQLTMDGEAALLLDVGGEVIVDTSDPNHKTASCTRPRVRLPRAAVDGLSTIVIADETATWTMVIDRPGIPCVLQVVAPAESYTPGDRISARVDQPGRYDGATLKGTTKEGVVLFGLWGGYHSTSDDLRFTIPAVEELKAPTEVDLTLFAAIWPTTLVCDGPMRCVAPVLTARATFTATLSP